MSPIDSVAMVLGYALIFVLCAAGAFIALVGLVDRITSRNNSTEFDD